MTAEKSNGRLVCVEPTWKSDLPGGLLRGCSGGGFCVAGEAGRRARGWNAKSQKDVLPIGS